MARLHYHHDAPPPKSAPSRIMRANAGQLEPNHGLAKDSGRASACGLTRLRGLLPSRRSFLATRDARCTWRANELSTGESEPSAAIRAQRQRVRQGRYGQSRQSSESGRSTVAQTHATRDRRRRDRGCFTSKDVTTPTSSWPIPKSCGPTKSSSQPLRVRWQRHRQTKWSVCTNGGCPQGITTEPPRF